MKVKIFLLAAIELLSFAKVSAQEQMPLIPVDPDVKIGHLDNGLTYYIRNNNYPKGVASYYIAQKVGAVQEEESQRGLAHLLEHLAFHNTDHFKDYYLSKFVQGNGGYINATTYSDKTVYYLMNLPTKRTSVVDSCMLVLKDWANGITLTDEALNEERDVVHNEYRTKVVGEERVKERNWPALLSGSKYGERFVVGLMSVIDTCKTDGVQAYYKKWYRPDNQALIIVGDVDVNYIETKIKELFSGIKLPANAEKVTDVAVPDNNDPIIIVDKDKELNRDIVYTYMKYDPYTREAKKGFDYLAHIYMENVITQMLSQRLVEKVQEGSCPYVSCDFAYQYYCHCSTKGAAQMSIVPKPGKTVDAYTAALTEAKRAADFGFTATEYERAMIEFMSLMEKMYTNRDKMENEELTWQYVYHFENGEPIPSVEQKYQIFQQIVPSISLDMVNAYAKKTLSLRDTNFVTLAEQVEKEGQIYVTPAELKSAFDKVKTITLEAYIDNTIQQPLIAEMPKAGKVMKSIENKQLGYKLLTLSNGVKVALKHTDFKNDEILCMGYANGGYSSLPESETALMSFFDYTTMFSGLGNFSVQELSKALTGKQVGVSMNIDENKRTISGQSTPKDIETLMQLLYLKMTNITKDENSFENLRQQIIPQLSQQSADPATVFQDSLFSTLYRGYKFKRVPKVEDVQAMNYDHCLELIHDLYSNACDFTFVFVGNYDEDTLMPLINTYLGSLPSSGKTFRNKNIPEYKGVVRNEFTRSMAIPNSQVRYYWSSDTAADTPINHILVTISKDMLFKYYFREIREKLSATYTPHADYYILYDAEGKARYELSGGAPINPDKIGVALPHVMEAMKQISTNPDASDLKEAKEQYINSINMATKNNGYWLNVICAYLTHGVDMLTNIPEMASSVNEKTLTDFLQNVILKSGNHAEIIMNATQE